MAQIKTTRWSELVLKVETTPGSGTFTALCTINAARGINFNANTSEDTIPDCDDLQKIQWLVREKVSLSVEVTGAGKVDKANVKTFFDWWKDKDTLKCQVILDDAEPNNVITFEGDYHLVTWSMAGDPGAPMVTADMSLQSSGEVEGEFGSGVGGGGGGG